MSKEHQFNHVIQNNEKYFSIYTYNGPSVNETKKTLVPNEIFHQSDDSGARVFRIIYNCGLKPIKIGMFLSLRNNLLKTLVGSEPQF